MCVCAFIRDGLIVEHHLSLSLCVSSGSESREDSVSAVEFAQISSSDAALCVPV